MTSPHPEVTPPPKLSPTTRSRCWWLTPPTNEELAKDEEEARESDMRTEEAAMDEASPSHVLLSPAPVGVKEPLLPRGPTTERNAPTPHDLHLAHQHVWPPAQAPVFTDEVYTDVDGDYVQEEEPGRRRAVAWAWGLVIVLFMLAAVFILLLVLFGAFTSLDEPLPQP